VKSVAGTDLAEDRYFNQLRVFVQLRNLQEQFDIAMEAITKFFKEEKDPFFRRGEAKGLEEGIEKGLEKGKMNEVENLIVKLGFSNEQAAEVAGVSVDFVEKVRATLPRQ
jgi:predicted transposase YdaD